MLPTAPPAPLRRLALWLLWGIAALVVTLLLAFLYITFVGISVDASFLRTRVAQAFSDNIGRPVRLDGPMEVEISATPKLRVGGLHIANAPGFGNEDFASLGEARLALDLWPLLFNKRLHIDELAGKDVQIRLQLRADGSNNWTFRRASQATTAPARAAAPSMNADQAFALLDIQKIALEQMLVSYTGPDAKPHFFSLNALAARSPSGEPLRMTLNGAVEQAFPYNLEFTGGPLADLASDKPWPVQFTLRFLSSTLTVNGHVSGASGHLTFGLGTENLIELGRLLQTRMPDVGPSGIAATVDFTPQRLVLTQLAGAMGNTSLTGDLDFDNSGAKPKLSGSLILPTLDLRPFLGEAPAPAEDTAPPPNLADLYRRVSAATFSLKRMNDADVDLVLGVRRWLSLPGDVHDVSLHLKLTDGLLEAPLQAQIAGVALSGTIEADANAAEPRFDLDLGTRDSDLGGLAELLTGARGVKGRLGRFALRLAARGDSGAELIRSLDVSIDVERGRFSYGNIEGERPVEFALDKLAVKLPAGKSLRADMQGDLLGHAFRAHLGSAQLETIMLHGRAPFDLSLRSGDVRARISGDLEAVSDASGPDIRFDVSAPRAGELASWFGFKPGAEVPAALSGTVTMRASAWQMDKLIAKLGRTTLAADLSRSVVHGRSLVKVNLSAEQVDVKELEGLLPEPQNQTAKPERPILDIPLLPQEIDLSDADISMRVKRFAGTPVEVRSLAFDGRIREGYMHPSPFSVNVSNTDLAGAILADLRGKEPTVRLWLYASSIDVGGLLKKLGVVKDLDATFGDFGINLIARSSRLGDMLERSELIGSIGGGRIVLRDPNTQATARVSLERGELRAPPGQPLKLTLNGALDDVPIAITFDTARAYQLANPAMPLPFTLNATGAQASVTLSGSIARPIGSDVRLALQANGRRFDTLNKLARTELPPWGPWSAAGKFRMSPAGYEIDDLRLQVGASVLNGEGRLDTASGRPRFNVALSAPIIQLDDFRFEGWSPFEKKPGEGKTPATAGDVRRKAAAASDDAQKLLSPEMLRRQDATVDVAVEQVLSGNDKLGSGRLKAKLENGRADIGPLEVNVVGGSAKLWLGYEPTERDVNVDLRVDVQKFDYGVLARRIKPDSDLRGSFSLKMDVTSRAQYLSDILRHGNGLIEFAVWPDNLKAGIFDVWAVNVLGRIGAGAGPGQCIESELRNRPIRLARRQARGPGDSAGHLEDARRGRRRGRLWRRKIRTAIASTGQEGAIPEPGYAHPGQRSVQRFQDRCFPRRHPRHGRAACYLDLLGALAETCRQENSSRRRGRVLSDPGRNRPCASALTHLTLCASGKKQGHRKRCPFSLGCAGRSAARKHRQVAQQIQRALQLAISAHRGKHRVRRSRCFDG